MANQKDDKAFRWRDGVMANCLALFYFTNASAERANPNILEAKFQSLKEPAFQAWKEFVSVEKDGPKNQMLD